MRRIAASISYSSSLGWKKSLFASAPSWYVHRRVFYPEQNIRISFSTSLMLLKVSEAIHKSRTSTYSLSSYVCRILMIAWFCASRCLRLVLISILVNAESGGTQMVSNQKKVWFWPLSSCTILLSRAIWQRGSEFAWRFPRPSAETCEMATKASGMF